MELFDEDIPLYPFLRFGKRGTEEEERRHSIIDVRTGEEIAWWTESFGTDVDVKQNLSKKRLKINTDSDVSSTNANDGPFDPTSIFVSGLDVRTSKEEIFYHFSSVGEVTRVTKLKSKLMGKFSGSAYVQYINSQIAENALFLNRSYIRGCSIIVQRKFKKTHKDDGNELKANDDVKLKVKEEDDNANRLFTVRVSNIESSFTQLDVAAHFQQSGDIQKLTVTVDEDNLGVAIIHFKQPAGVDNALTLNNTWFGENVILVEKYSGTSDGEQESNNNEVMKQEGTDFDLCSVFVGNLGPNTIEADLSFLFSSAGDIERITILKNKATGFYLPSAYIQFRSQDEASKALEKDGINLHGSSLTVQRKRKTIPRRRH